MACACLTTALGAYGYTRLTSAGAALVIGTMLILSVPLRRLLKRHDRQDRRYRVGRRRGRLRRRGRRHLGLGRDPAVAVDGRGPGRRRRDRHRRRDLGRHRHSSRFRCSALPASSRAQVLAFAVLIGVSRAARRVPRQGLCRANAGAHPHRDPRCGGHRRRDHDDIGGGAQPSLGASHAKSLTSGEPAVSAGRPAIGVRLRQPVSGRCRSRNRNNANLGRHRDHPQGRHRLTDACR